VDVRNELKELLDITESTSKNDKDIPCIVEIDLWEQKSIDRIRDIAAKARTGVNEVLAKNMAEMRCRFEQLTVDVQQRQKEGNYLENDMDAIKSQIEQLRNDVENVTKKIHVDTTISKNIEWDTLIYVTEEELSGEATSEIIQPNSHNTQKNTIVSSMAASSEQVAAGKYFNYIPSLL
jgi:predicted RNase H-like nuclease (RuvC/YqgF family)